MTKAPYRARRRVPRMRWAFAVTSAASLAVACGGTTFSASADDGGMTDSPDGVDGGLRDDSGRVGREGGLRDAGGRDGTTTRDGGKPLDASHPKESSAPESGQPEGAICPAGTGTCSSPSDCPPSAECTTATCNAGCCGHTNDPSGSCSAGVCDGQGQCVQCVTSENCPPTENQCTAVRCDSNVCGQVDLTPGTPCSEDGGHYCNAGACLQCVDVSDCGNTTPPECYEATCTSGGVCGTAPSPPTTTCVRSSGTSGSDGPGFCNGMGLCVECNTPSNCPAPSNPCIDATCEVNICGTTNAPSETKCPTGVCNGTGSCVQCVSNGDCSGVNIGCVGGTCVTL
jgi:hypothetical protein